MVVAVPLHVLVVVVVAALVVARVVVALVVVVALAKAHGDGHSITAVRVRRPTSGKIKFNASLLVVTLLEIQCKRLPSERCCERSAV